MYHGGVLVAKMGKAVEARDQLETALKLRPNSSDARFQLAAVLRVMGEHEQARAELQTFEKEKREGVGQNVGEIKANQANEYLQTGEAQRAVDLYREAIANDSKNARTYYNLGLALDRLRDYRGERDALEKGLSIDPSFAPLHNQIGFLSLQAGRTAEAETQFTTATPPAPQYSEGQNHLGVGYGQQGKPAEEGRLFRQ